MANAFSICSLSQDWRAELGTVGTGNLPKTVKDPSWLFITRLILVRILERRVVLMLKLLL